jgi:hypothetical protein
VPEPVRRSTGRSARQFDNCSELVGLACADLTHTVQYRHAQYKAFSGTNGRSGRASWLCVVVRHQEGCPEAKPCQR